MNYNQIRNLGLSSLSAVVKNKHCLGLPVHLTIEPTNVCNLHCPVCETGAGILNRAKGFMSFDVFKQILHSVGSQVNTLLLYYMGEPFMHKDIYNMAEYAVGKGIYVSTCTNGELVDCYALLESGISEVNFQISGLSQDTHEQYRVDGHLDKTLSNLMDVLKLRAKKNYKTKVIVGFIVMKHNEHELPHVDELKRAGVDVVQVITPCVRNIEQGNKFLPSDDRYWYYDHTAFAGGVLRPRKQTHNRCWWIYFSTVVTWDGYVLPCCRDAKAEYIMGNILEQSFSKIWNNEQYKKFRWSLAFEQRALKLCGLCSGYRVPRLY